MKQTLIAAAAVALMSISNLVSAAPVMYTDAGAENSVTYSFTAAHTGDIVAYFAGADALYSNTISLLINGVDTKLSGLENHTAHYGDALNFGTAKAGDSLTFRLNVLTTEKQWFSDAALNADDSNHVFSNTYVGDSLIPTGTYIGFEDKAKKVSDLDYNDLQFVFTNVAVQPVPEPETYGMLLAGLGLVGFMATRRKRAAK
ncbi:MAG: FxDxF family PEP-CTERM protein [Pseudomonadota bacterium]